jgi:flagellar P-ring protein precursor FlgI
MNAVRVMIALLLGVCLCTVACAAVRIKDIARPQGERHNQLVGYGLVVGLDGTGDSAQSVFTNQAVRNLVTRFGNAPEAGAQIKTKNAAVVVLTADLPPFVKPGDRIDVVVSSLGDARSLRGGVLLQAPLEGADGRTYAMAQGPVSLGGFTAAGPGAQVSKNHPTVGRIPNGALVEAAVAMEVESGGVVCLSLHQPDYGTAVAVARAVNAAVPEAEAVAQDAATVSARLPVGGRLPVGRFANATEFVAAIGELTVSIDAPARIVINERTGTIVVGGPVTIAPVAVAHGGLTVEVKTFLNTSQPLPLSRGETVVTPDTSVRAAEGEAVVVPLRAATVDDLVRCLNALHAAPSDLIAILQAMKEAGALQAELEVL